MPESVILMQSRVLVLKVHPNREILHVDQFPQSNPQRSAGERPLGKPFRLDLSREDVLGALERPLKFGMGIRSGAQVPEDLEKTSVLTLRRIQGTKLLLRVVETVEPGTLGARRGLQRSGNVTDPPEQIAAFQNQISANCCAAERTAARSSLLQCRRT